MRILLVEDEAALSDVIARGLRQAGLAVDPVYDGQSALQMLEISAYDVVVLDRQLPGVHGDEVCKSAVALPLPPRVLMLTAAGNLDDRVRGLEIGADDYLSKPFAMAELVARVQALGRRPSLMHRPVIEIGDVRIDTNRRLATRADRDLGLTRKEFGVLEALATMPGSVISAEDLLERVWDEAADPFTNAVRITMMTLRRKLGEPPIIETVVGVGYRLAGGGS
jgi:DNA-binding response OmpR family regulator